jgi:phosphoenolpyruvate-protein phosphotransferase (PTS system enzyme I)
MKIIKGIGSAGSKALAKCVKIPKVPEFSGNEKISQSDINAEILKFETAVEKMVDTLDGQMNELSSDSINAQVLDVHKSLIKDPMLTGAILSNINNMQSAISSVKNACDVQIGLLSSLDDAYFRERALDMADIQTQMLFIVAGKEYLDMSKIDFEAVLIGEDIGPSMMANANPKFIKGIVTEKGSKTSHTAILAQSMDIVAVMGVDNSIEDICKGELVFADGESGKVCFDITDEEKIDFEKQVEQAKAFKQHLLSYKDVETKTKDGKRVLLCGNIMSTEMCSDITSINGDGSGLFRTEFLYMERKDLPSEDEQFLIYKNVAEKFGDKPVIIRTFDIGGDKKVECLDLPVEENPFLGYRALRICLDSVDLFETQINAILRASVFGNLYIMFPMVTNISEIKQSKAILKSCMKKLDEQAIAYDKNIKIGIMVEVPSIAVVADKAIKEVDFFSIGSNDLTGYTVAADRMNSKIAHLYTHFDIGVLTLVRNTIKACVDNHKLCGVCGEMAGDMLAIPLLVGFGLEEFSVSPAYLLKARKMITLIDSVKARGACDVVMSMSETQEIVAYIKEEFKEEFAALLAT